MYHTPISAHGFNHQSFYRQPVSNLRQINDLISNRENKTQRIQDGILYGQFPSEYENFENQNYASTNGSNGISFNNYVNGLSKLPPIPNTPYQSMRQSRPTNAPSGINQDRSLVRQSSEGAMRENKNGPSQETGPLSTSRSAGTINDNIQRERRSHTMAPLARITGPSTNITTNMFASTIAPSDAQTLKSSTVTQGRPDQTANGYPQSNGHIHHAVGNGRNDEDDNDADEEEEEEEDDEDDDAPIIVKVQYDPDAGGPPSEDIIRQAVDNRLKGQTNSRNGNDPIVLNFLNQSARSQIPARLNQSQQPILNRATQAGPQSIGRHPQQLPVSQQQLLLQQQQQQRLQLQEKHRQMLQLQEKQRQQQQQQLQLQEQQQQQQIQLQEQQRQQHLLQLQEKQRQQQQLQLQERQRQQQLQLQEKQRHQQLLQLQEKQRQQQLQEQLRLQEKQRQQQLLQLQDKQRQQQLLQLQEKQRQQQEQLQLQERQRQQEQQQDQLQLHERQRQQQQQEQLQLQERQRQQEQQQDQLQLHERQRQQQQQEQLQLQERQRQQEQQEQLRLQEKQRQQQEQLQLQEKQRQQQLFLQEKQRQQQLLQLQEEQRKQQWSEQPQQQQQPQFQPEQPKQQAYFQEIRRKLESDQQEIHQLIQRQLQLERQQKHQQLFQEQQRQRQQELQQRNQQGQQPQQYEQTQSYGSLPPRGPRPSRTVPSMRTMAAKQPPLIVLPNNRIYSTHHPSSVPTTLANPQQIPTITIQKLPSRAVNSALATSSIPTGLNAYGNHSYQHVLNTFIPIQFTETSERQHGSVNNPNMHYLSQNLLQRPHTAPSFTEMFRPSSALDTPELSKETLSSMLGEIPDLRGCQFNIEYLEPDDPAGYPIPTLLEDVNPKYPEAVIVDQLPNNIIQHVRSSSNAELKAALDLNGQPERSTRSPIQSKPPSSTLKKAPTKVLRHSSQYKRRVEKSRPLSLELPDDETEQTIAPSSKQQNSN